ncbi:hypothetical protein FH972_026316 [Carpinus fangiana]|uniref:Fork-head domain-containing protein n=1 Tax=Carpinus fangiana TaxID=176857 RepID=A0A5N6L3Z6_9ROSI|nr:hypothetical protein FH972_026316 [Carpinus fangiana]
MDSHDSRSPSILIPPNLRSTTSVITFSKPPTLTSGKRKQRSHNPSRTSSDDSSSSSHDTLPTNPRHKLLRNQHITFSFPHVPESTLKIRLDRIAHSPGDLAASLDFQLLVACIRSDYKIKWDGLSDRQILIYSTCTSRRVHDNRTLRKQVNKLSVKGEPLEFWGRWTPYPEEVEPVSSGSAFDAELTLSSKSQWEAAAAKKGEVSVVEHGTNRALPLSDRVVRCICSDARYDRSKSYVHCKHCHTSQHQLCYYRPGVDVSDAKVKHICAECRPAVASPELAQLVKDDSIMLRESCTKYNDDGARPQLSWLQLITESFEESPCLLLTAAQISARIARKYAYWRNELQRRGPESRLRSNVAAILSQTLIRVEPPFIALRPTTAKDNKNVYWVSADDSVGLLNTRQKLAQVRATTFGASSAVSAKPVGASADAFQDLEAGSSPHQKPRSPGTVPVIPFYVKHNFSSDCSIEPRKIDSKAWQDLRLLTTVDVVGNTCAPGDVVEVAVEGLATSFALVKEIKAMDTGHVLVAVWWFWSKEDLLAHAHTRKKRDKWPQGLTHLLSNWLDIIHAAAIRGKLGNADLTRCTNIVDGNSKSTTVRATDEEAVSWVCESLQGLPRTWEDQSADVEMADADLEQDDPLHEGLLSPELFTSKLIEICRIEDRIQTIRETTAERRRRFPKGDPWPQRDPVKLIQEQQERIEKLTGVVRADSGSAEQVDARLAHHLKRTHDISVDDFEFIVESNLHGRVGLTQKKTGRTSWISIPSTRLKRDVRFPEMASPDAIAAWIEREDAERRRILMYACERKAFLLEEQLWQEGRWWEANDAA